MVKVNVIENKENFQISIQYTDADGFITKPDEQYGKDLIANKDAVVKSLIERKQAILKDEVDRHEKYVSELNDVIKQLQNIKLS